MGCATKSLDFPVFIQIVRKVYWHWSQLDSERVRKGGFGPWSQLFYYFQSCKREISHQAYFVFLKQITRPGFVFKIDSKSHFISNGQVIRSWPIFTNDLSNHIFISKKQNTQPKFIFTKHLIKTCFVIIKWIPKYTCFH